MSESLRNDGRMGSKDLKDVEKIKSGKLKPTDIKEKPRLLFGKKIPSLWKFSSKDVVRAAKERIDKGFGVNKTGEAVYLGASAIKRYGKQQAAIERIQKPSKEKIIELGEKIIAKYGNLFQMYEKL